MMLSAYRWLVPAPACALLQSSFGSFYAYGVFTSRLHAPALTYALGLSAALLSGCLTAAGLALHRSPPPRSPARALALLSAALLGIAGVLPVFAAPDNPRPVVLALAAGALGAGYGVLYVVSIHVVQAWFPEAPGTATGVIVAAGGAGTLGYVALNTLLANVYRENIPVAMRVSAAAATLVALAAAACISVPPSLHWSPQHGHSLDLGGIDELTPLSPQKESPQVSTPRLTVAEMLSTFSFYCLLVSVTASVGPGFGVILHGSRMQTAIFGVAPDLADSRFFGITLVGVLGRLAVGVIIDAYTASVARRSSLSAASDTAAAPFKAAKSVNLLLLVTQGSAILVIWPLVRTGPASAKLFAGALSLIYLTFSGAAVVTACLCRATFSKENSTLAFSLVGLAIGIGDVAFSSLVAGCAERNPFEYSTMVVSEHARDYDDFFIVSLLFTVVGFVASVLLAPSDAAQLVWERRLSRNSDAAPPSLYKDLICTDECVGLERSFSDCDSATSLGKSGSLDSLTFALALPNV
jgi:MFS family permease